MPLIPNRERSLPYSFQSDAEALERRERLLLFAQAKAGREDALADLRDGWGIRTLVLDGVTLIQEGVLVGSRVRS